MNRTLYLITIAIVASTGILTAANLPNVAKEEVLIQSSIPYGREWIESLRSAYEAGKYDVFLANLQSDYQKMVTSGNFTEFRKMREVMPTDEKFQTLTQKWDAIQNQLIQDRNDKLKKAISEENNGALSSRFQTIFNNLTDQEKTAIYYITALRFKTPDMAKNEDEKKLIEIDLASEYMDVQLDLQYAEKPFNDRMEKHAIINMNAMRAMQIAAHSFTDQELQNTVLTAGNAFDSWQAKNWDLFQINQLIKHPTNDVERKIASIFTDHKTLKEEKYQSEFLTQFDK